MWKPRFDVVFPKVCYLDYGVSSVQAPQVKNCFYRFCLDDKCKSKGRDNKEETMSENFRNTDVKGKKSCNNEWQVWKVHEISSNIYMIANKKQTVGICSTYMRILVFEKHFPNNSKYLIFTFIHEMKHRKHLHNIHSMKSSNITEEYINNLDQRLSCI